MFSGPYTNDMPDIVILPEERYEFHYTTPEGKLCEFKEDHIVGSHTMEGVFIAHGPDIKNNNSISKANLIDIVPTVLHMHGMKIPRDIDGEIRMNIFKPGSSEKKRKPVYSKDIEEQKIEDAIKNIEI